MKHNFCLLAFLPLVSSCGPVNYGCVDRFNLYSDFESLDADFRSSLKQENEKNSEPCVTRIFDPVALSAPSEENRIYSLTGLCCCKYRREGNFEQEKCPDLHFAEGAIFLKSASADAFVHYFLSSELTLLKQTVFASSLEENSAVKDVGRETKALVFKEAGESLPFNYPNAISRFRYSRGEEEDFSSRFYVLTESESKVPYASLLFSKNTSLEIAQDYSQKFLTDINQKLLS